MRDLLFQFSSKTGNCKCNQGSLDDSEPSRLVKAWRQAGKAARWVKKLSHPHLSSYCQAHLHLPLLCCPSVLSLPSVTLTTSILVSKDIQET